MSGRIGLPTLRVEIAWGGTPVHLKTAAGRAGLTWTDVTPWLRVAEGITFGHGRTSESDMVTAGTATFPLNTRNAAGVVFDGGNPRKLRTPIRVRWYGVPFTYDSDVTYDNAAYTYDDDTPSAPVTLWLGTVTDWGGGWSNGVRPFTRVTAVDLVNRFNIQTLRQLPLQTLLGQATTHATAWVYPLDDEAQPARDALANATTSSSGLATQSVGSGGSATFGQGYAPGALNTEAEAPAVAFTPDAVNPATNYQRLAGTVTPVPTTAGGDFGVSLYVLPASVAAAATALILTDIQSAQSSLRVGIDATGKPTATLTTYSTTGGAWTATPVTVTVTAAAALSTADWQHLAVTVDHSSTLPGATVTLYVNGVNVASSYNSAVVVPPLTRLQLGDAWNGSIANVAAHNSLTFLTTLSDSGALGSVAGGRTGYDNEATHRRFERLMWAAGWQGVSVQANGYTTMSQMPVRGDSLAAAAQKIADTEAAPWYIDGQGRPTFNGRGSRYNVSPAFTIPATIINPGTQFTLSDVGMVNKMTATRPGGTQAIRVNQPSIDAYDEYGDERTLYVRTDADLEDVAQATVNLKGDPGIRSDTIEVDLHVSAASITNVAAAVTATVGTKMRITGVPTVHGTPSTIDYFVEGVQDNVTATGWQRTFNVSPVGLSEVWQLDDTTRSVLDTTTRLGF